MAARPTWKGFLKVSLVTVPVRVFPATDTASSLSFNQLHAECQTRIRQKKWCPTCDRQVDKTEIVKGYEFEKGHYVVMDEEDIAKARPESTRVINLLRFAEVDSIDPIYVERPYYLAPDGKVAGEAFGVLREALPGEGWYRQACSQRTGVSGGGPAQRARACDVHAEASRRAPQDVGDRRARSST